MFLSLFLSRGSSTENGLTRQTSSPSSHAEFSNDANTSRAQVVLPTQGGPPIIMRSGRFDFIASLIV